MNLLHYITAPFARLMNNRQIGIGAEVKTPYGKGVVTGGALHIKLIEPTNRADYKGTTIIRNGGNFTLPINKVK